MKVALITGGSRGIGLGIAKCLAAEGWHLAINGVRDESAVSEVLAELKSAGVDITYCQGDISDTESRQRMVQAVQDRFGRLNMLVNNAGVAPRVRKDILETTEESFDYVLSTNLAGTFFLTQNVANYMIRQRAQEKDDLFCIINITSISSQVASINRGEYCIAKAGLSMVTRLFATRLAEYDIPVYEIQPGVIRTDMTSAVTEKYDKMIEGGLTLQKRWGNPVDVGKVVAALARGDFPYSTGQVSMVDGGLTIPRL
jgi:NAD(P)-dependent dehydrogenase (short-subunit alcohol dehydrogenase family)